MKQWALVTRVSDTCIFTAIWNTKDLHTFAGMSAVGNTR